MPYQPSKETLKIREIVEGLSDEQLATLSLRQIREFVENVGLDWAEVYTRVNNELARIRRKRGVRVRSKLKAVLLSPSRPRRPRPAPLQQMPDGHLVPEDFEKLVGLLEEIGEFREYFDSWVEAREAAELLFRLQDGFSSRSVLRRVMDQEHRKEQNAIEQVTKQVARSRPVQ